MKRSYFKNILYLLTIFIVNPLFATHYRAGEITYKQITLLTYEITAITYTDPTNKSADRPEMEILFGDGKSEIVKRSNGNGEMVNSKPASNLIQKNIYITTHTYPGPYGYIISLTDQNRIKGIININGGESVNIPFYVESFLQITAGIGFNQSPVLKLPPIDVGCIFRTFKHNPAAYDPDGDSLAFTLISPKSGVGVDVPGFVIPAFTDSFSLAVNDGQVTWTNPKIKGPYNLAIKISEFRKGILIGYVVRDMQVFIDQCFNKPPLINKVADTCIAANQLLKYTLFAKDSDVGQIITINKYGGPFDYPISPATITPDPAIGPYTGVSTLFRWEPSCNAIRYEKHQAIFRATDDDPTNPMSDIMFWNIKVVGPAPKNVQIKLESNGFKLSWNRDSCNLAFGYKIYRKIDSSYWKHGPCETGVPSNIRYVLFDTTQGVNNNSYFDNENGRGISPLIRYCYLITSWYPSRTENGTIIQGESVESYASEEVCNIILRTKPIITNVSVEKTSVDKGKIFVKWIRPNLLDSNQFPAPYQVQLQRSLFLGSKYADVGIPFNYATFSDIKDEQVIDSNLNTLDNQYYYKVIFSATKPNLIPVEESIAASSVRLSILSNNRSLLLKWKVSVPWQNYLTTIYKKNALNTYDSIGNSTTNQFWDTGLYNGFNYCYYLKTTGNYNLNYYPNILYNNSQEACAAPKDTIRPCTPLLNIETPCNSFNIFKITLNWVYPDSCEKDVTRFKIYWRKNMKEKWSLIDSVPWGVNTYSDVRESLKFSIAGCYSVIAVDSFDNPSYFANSKCIDNCPYYVIPNIFTPNNDMHNDLLNPFPYRFIDKIDINIYNRWGLIVFQTNDIDINWNGKDQKTGIECTEGVYYYICDVYESYLDGSKKRTLRGSLQLIR